MIESVMERLLIEHAQTRGWITRKVQWIGRRGAPDRLFAKDGRVLFVELKRPGGKTSANQDRELAELSAAGVEVHLIDNLKDGYAVFADQNAE